ncbi:TetR/AcrR family transcriptional regulator [Vibrio comitans]|uniref:HTH tetR-type domain-containing protein n=1 Tax=Vibrio comitans NBRC 102076 TaxID=1219078 RepID=A0A4Y3INT3_9VIBR|nr:TetR/AcrR family transcriptional regulator [Vibrio comitans]GEA61171.1 hypothetical protein VCO01S_23640 [Vibrio comitans NBRC 102076]
MKETKRYIGRQNRQKATQTRADILNEAYNLFSSNGFEGTSLRMIANHSGVTHATITHHFGCKKQVYLAAIQECANQYCSTIQTIANKHSNQPNKAYSFSGLVSELLQTTIKYAGLFRLLGAVRCEDFEEYACITAKIDTAHEELLPLFADLKSRSPHLSRLSFNSFILLLIGTVSVPIIMKESHNESPSAQQLENKDRGSILEALLF